MALPKRVLVAPDKFKGTLTAAQAARAIVRGLRRAWPHTEFTVQTLADGGEGFARNLIQATGGRLRRMRTMDAAGRPCNASWGLLGDGRTAVFDLAEASGLAQLPLPLRNPEATSTYGSGLMLRRALSCGARTVIVGLGGSATNEGGIGLAQALGFRFLDANDRDIPLTGAGLLALDRILAPATLPRVRIVAATDVDNVLFGRHGAAYQFAPQKGADTKAVHNLDRGLRRLAAVTLRCLGLDLADQSGAGAAGGCGFGLTAFLRAETESGFDLLRRHLRLDDLLRKHDLVITGEGAFDRTSLAGKAPFRIAQLAALQGIAAWGIFGRIDLPAKGLPFARSASLTGGEAPETEMTAAHARRLSEAAFRLARG